MHLTFLGTGSAMPTGERSQSGLLVETDDQRLLVDCGSGVLNALAATDRGYEDLDAVLLSHHHLDHVADLLPLLKARWLADAPSLTVAGPDGTETLIEELLAVHEYLTKYVDPDLRDIERGTTTLAGFDVETVPVQHSMAGFGYRITPAGETEPTVVYSGDTVADPDILRHADGAEVLVHDCSFPDDVQTDNHPTARSLGRALADAGVTIGTVYLTHLYPHTDGRHEEMLASISEHYSGTVRFAEDGRTVTLE